MTSDCEQNRNQQSAREDLLDGCSLVAGPSLRGRVIESPWRSPRSLLSGVRAKLTSVKFFSPPGALRKRFMPSN